MQAGGANTSVELAGGPVSAPLEAAWESISERPSPRPRSAHVRRLAETRRTWRVRARQRNARLGDAQPVHGGLGAFAFRRAARARLEDRASGGSRRSRHRCRRCAAARAAADPRRVAAAGRARSRTLPISTRATVSRHSSSARPMRSRRRPPGPWRLRRRSASIPCSSTAGRGVERPTSFTRSATPFSPTTAALESCRCRPRSSWSSSSGR